VIVSGAAVFMQWGGKIMLTYRSGVVGLSWLLALAVPVGAQTAADEADDGAEELQEVIVTGTRLATGFDTPTPVAVLTTEDLQDAVPNNMGESLAQLPSLAGSVQNTTSGQGSANSQTNGQNLLNLRQLGSDRTLILLDGQRLGVTNVVGAVDINVIPQNLVRRVEVVTGGASASYGSDAVAGVVNFILDTQFQGLKVETNIGQTAYSDSQNGKVSVAFGKHLSSRARVISGDWFGVRTPAATGTPIRPCRWSTTPASGPTGF
jgi:iron complex outermembrane recepter protein